jgi:hypothetical protein
LEDRDATKAPLRITLSYVKVDLLNLRSSADERGAHMRTLAVLVVLGLTVACHRASPPYVIPPTVGRPAAAQVPAPLPPAKEPARP